MKKTIQTNLCGLSFLLDEDAFARLQAYLDEVRVHLREDADEIMADIENNFAEKFSAYGREKIISLPEIEVAIAAMGSPEDFDEPAEIDAAIEAKAPKKLYRDMDNAVLGGVCSGLAAYFGIDPVFVRLAFVIFTFIGGSGVIAYLVLLIATPEAKTTAQKLAMHGQPINLGSLEQAAKKSGEQIKKMTASPTWKKILNLPVVVLQSLVNFCRRIFHFFGPVLRLTLAFGLFFIAVGGFVGLTITGVFLTVNSRLPYVLNGLPLRELLSNLPLNWLLATGYLAAVLPFIALFFLAIGLLKKKNWLSFPAGLSVFILWLLAITAFGSLLAANLPQTLQTVRHHPQLQTETKTLPINDFQKLIVKGNDFLHIELRQAASTSLTVTGRAPDLADFLAEETDGTLTISERRSPDNEYELWRDTPSYNLVLTTPKLSDLDIARARLVAADFKQETLNILARESSLDWQNANIDQLFITAENSDLSWQGQNNSAKINLSASYFDSKNWTVNELLAEGANHSRFTVNGDINQLSLNLKENSGWHGLTAKIASASLQVADTSVAILGETAVATGRAEDDARIFYQTDNRAQNDWQITGAAAAIGYTRAETPTLPSEEIADPLIFKVEGKTWRLVPLTKNRAPLNWQEEVYKIID